MKAKTYRFIFSALLICFAAVGKAQTIDGKLYTPFNNYYQWIGGKFNSNLNIPKVAATSGRDTGGIRYNLADSLMYVWTGSQWRVVGAPIDTSSLSNRIQARVKYSDTAAMLSPYLRKIDTASLSNRINQKLNISDTAAMLAPYLDYVPTLQQVTTAGNTTTDGIEVFNILINNNLSNSYGISEGAEGVFQSLYIANDTNYLNYASVRPTNITDFRVIELPDSSGILTQRVTINGTTYNTAANGVVDLGTIQSDTATVVKAYVTNAEAVTITKGQVVYIFGAQGDRASVKLAKNTSDTFSSKTLGIVRADIAAGQAGWVTTQGQVSGINLGAYTAGDILWLDSVAGGFTKTKPVAPKHGVFIGVVERANAGNGIIYVKPQNGVELDEVHNVLITSPTNNQVLSYTASTGIWQNKSVTTALGYTPLNVTDTAAMLNGRLSGITLNTSSAIHTSPVTFSRIGGAWSGTLSLANQSGFTVFRRASGTGTPSFGTIDSSYFGGTFRGQVRANTNDYRRDIDTVPLAVFNVGSASAGDTAAFSTSTLAGSFYLDGTDTMFVTSYRVALQGTSASITPEVWFNDSLNVTAGGTRLATGSAITNLTTGTSVTATTNKIPPANFVFVRFSAVTTKPTYFTLTLFGYRIRKQ